MPLQVRFEDKELPALKELLNRALNTWEPRKAPQWAFELERAVERKLNPPAEDVGAISPAPPPKPVPPVVEVEEPTPQSLNSAIDHRLQGVPE